MIRKMVREFAEAEMRPIAQQSDLTGEFPWQTIRKMGPLGLMGMPIPKEYGGGGVDSVSYAIGIEEISRVCAATGVIVAVHTSVGTYPIYLFGSEEQKRKYLPKLARGEMIGAFALTEPNAGSDAGAASTTAKPDGDFYILNGTKIFITNGMVAGTVIVLGLTDKSKGTRGMTAFIVEEGTKGFSHGSREKTMGQCASDTSELVFENCAVPKENMLGKEDEGFKLAMTALDGGRVGIAAQAVGIAQAALDESIKYSKEREQFGKTISKFQAIQWMLADMATEIEAARLLTYSAACLKDAKMKFSKEASMAKMYASEVATRTTSRAVQIHGGYGYTKDYTVERLYRDARITEIYEGTSEVQRMVIAANLGL